MVGLGQDLRTRVRRRHGGNHQHIHGSKSWRNALLQSLDLCLAGEEVCRRVARATEDRQALSDRGSLVQQRSGLDERCEPAGTRPESAVSVPRAKLTSPRANATAEPELEPPPAGGKALGTAP